MSFISSPFFNIKSWYDLPNVILELRSLKIFQYISTEQVFPVLPTVALTAKKNYSSLKEPKSLQEPVIKRYSRLIYTPHKITICLLKTYESLHAQAFLYALIYTSDISAIQMVNLLPYYRFVPIPVLQTK